MKYAAIAALVATVSAAEAAKKYKCAADPIEKVEGFKDQTADTCTTPADDATEKAKVDGLAAAQNTAIKAFLDKCGALPNAIDTATHAKITCDATTMTTTYYSADTCADDKKVTLSPATKGWAKLTSGSCGMLDWNGLAISGAPLSYDATKVKSIKVTLKAGVEDKGDATTTDAKALGAAVAATTLAVAATLY